MSVSPAFLDQYITAARQIAKLAVGNRHPPVANVKYSLAANQNGERPLPPGTRGGMRFKHNFPADGEYRINILDLSLGLYTSTLENESTLVIMIRRQDRLPQTDWRPCRSGACGSQGPGRTR